MLKFSIFLILAFISVLNTSLGLPSESEPKIHFSQTPIELVKDFIIQIKTSKPPKIDYELTSLVYYSYKNDLEYVDLFFSCVAEINAALEQSKYIPRVAEANERFDRKAICIYLGKDWQIERFFKTTASSINYQFTSKQTWHVYWFWSNDRTIYSALIGINSDQIYNLKCGKYFMTRSLLHTIGFPGNYRNKNKKMSVSSIFNAENNVSCSKSKCLHTVDHITKWDKCIILFCEKYLYNIFDEKNIIRIIEENWPLFAMNYDLRSE